MKQMPGVYDNYPINNMGPGINRTPTRNPRDSMVVDIITGGDTAAFNYYVIPGTTVFLIDFNIEKMYIKTSDGNGIPQPMRMFELNEINVQQQANNGTASEISNLQAQLDELKKLFIEKFQNGNNSNTIPQKQPFNNSKRKES